MSKDNKVLISLLVFYLVLFLPFIGSVNLFDWDEVNFAEAAREMVVSGDWFNVTINFDPFWEKPPLFLWLQALSIKMFGVSSFSARLPNVIIGLITIIILFKSVFNRYDIKAAALSVLLYLGSFTPQLYFKTGIIDPLFNLLMFSSVIWLLKSIETKQTRMFFYAGLALGLAILTKGPVAILLVGLTGLVYQIMHGTFYSVSSLLKLILGLLIFPAIYFGYGVYKQGWWHVQEFLAYQVDLFQNPVASHGQPFYYHILVLVLACFPMVALVAPALFIRVNSRHDISYIRWLKVMFWVVLIVFSLVTTKIVHYSSMCYLPLAVVGGVYISTLENIGKLQKWLIGLVSIVWLAILLGIGLLAFPSLNLPNYLSGLVQEEFIRSQLMDISGFPILPLLLAAFILVLGVYTIFRYSQHNIYSILLAYTLLYSMVLLSVSKPIEETIQGKWVNHLTSYKTKPMAHFALGFKSYAVFYYTQQERFADYESAKAKVLDKMGKDSYYDVNSKDRKMYEALLRDYVVRETDIPLSISLKSNRVDDMKHYPMLKQVFNANGYVVYERRPYVKSKLPLIHSPSKSAL